MRQEKLKTQRELDELKISRLETMELERPSSRSEELARLESRRELEEIKKVRSSLSEDRVSEVESQGGEQRTSVNNGGR